MNKNNNSTMLPIMVDETSFDFGCVNIPLHDNNQKSIVNGVIACPWCGCQFTHIGTPVYSNGNDNYDADWDLRGDLIKIPMSSECGCEWELCIGFHKGYSPIFSRLIKECDPLPGDNIMIIFQDD